MVIVSDCLQIKNFVMYPNGQIGRMTDIRKKGRKEERQA